MLVLAGTLVYAAIQNDAFTDLTPPLDDVGFTHDNVLAIGVTHGDYIVGGSVLDRWITSRTDRRRWDQLDALATIERSWFRVGPSDEPARPVRWRLTTSARLGPTVGGNFGGRYLQNGWHSISGTGPTIEQGLANDYSDDDRVGVLAGARAHGAVALRDARAELYVNADAQLALAAGVSTAESSLGGRVGAHHLGAHVEAAVTRYHVADPNLALPGGYGVGWKFEWRAGIDISWSRYQLAYEYRANEGGSGEPIGVVAFSLH